MVVVDRFESYGVIFAVTVCLSAGEFVVAGTPFLGEVRPGDPCAG